MTRPPVPTVSSQDLPVTGVQNPCVRNCCLDDKDVCLGCGRKLSEITGWHGFSADEKASVLEKARARRQARQW